LVLSRCAITALRAESAGARTPQYVKRDQIETVRVARASDGALDEEILEGD